MSKNQAKNKVKNKAEMKTKYKVKSWQGASLLEHLLNLRGITSASDQQAFLNPEYEQGCFDPFLMADMQKAVQIISETILSGHKIVIYSDFDADGIPGAVVFNDFFKKISFTNFEHYIPHRHKEGFGFHAHAVKELRENYPKEKILIITVDCGIADIETVRIANELGIDVIITDHHLTKEVLPDALAVLDPKREDCKYPDKMLCGAGVAFKVVQALGIYDRQNKNNWNIQEGSEKWSLDVVGIATLSDMVPLLGENRVLAKYGLLVLRKTRRLGLIKLFRSLKIDQKNIVEDDVLFSITPRINAASRMADPYDAFKLLIADNDADAESAVKHLNNINDERKSSVAVMVKEMHKIIKERDLSEAPVLVLGNPNWKPPLLGLVATNLLRDYGRPVFLWGQSDEGEIKGSCRSDGIVNLADIMKEVQSVEKDLFTNYGGHTFSGGFGISSEKIHVLYEAIQNAYNKLYPNTGDEIKEKILEVDAELEQVRINQETWSVLEKLAPFGEANPKPIFILKKAQVKNIKKFGKTNEHLEVELQNGRKGVKFFDAKEFDWLIESLKEMNGTQAINIVFNIEKSFFRNYPEIRMRVLDIYVEDVLG